MLYPFQTDALERAFREPSYLFFNHDTGCLYGEAEIFINRGGAGKRMAIRDVVTKFNGGHAGYGPNWDRNIPTYVAREVDGVTRSGKLIGAWASGTKTTYTVTTNSGRTIRATDEHPFYTERGWLRLDQLVVGDQVHIRGNQKAGNPRKPKIYYKEVAGLFRHPHATKRSVKHSPYRVVEHRLVVEAALNNIPYGMYIQKIKTGNTEGITFLNPTDWAVHHVDHNHRNNDLSNLKVMTHSEHHALHAHEGKENHVLYKIITEAVVSIELFGEEETFDLEVADNPHNFIANGFVVHNTGKSVVAVAGMQEMINNRHEIDLALVFTLRLNKKNFVRTIQRMTKLRAKNIEGVKDARKKAYEKANFDVLVMNYEKAHFDFDELSALVKGKRVLFVFDEVQKILLVNRAEKAMRKLVKVPRFSAVWPMSASVVENDPWRFWRCFSFTKPNPLGTQESFKKRYVEKTILKDYGRRQEYVPVWNLDALKDIPERVADYTHVVRKNDPEVRPFFKENQTIVETVQLSDQDRELYDIVLETVRADFTQLSHLAKISYYQTLRLICNTTEALNVTDNQVAAFIRSQGLVFDSRTSAKFEMIIDKIKSIRDQGDKVVMFTHWVPLSLLPLARRLTEEGVTHVTHYGTGMSAREAQEAQDFFKGNPDCTVFLSSDAGSHGLNFQEAKYTINVECPHSYDILMQRNNRIDRIDSHHDLLTNYIYVTENTLEEQIWQTNDQRRKLSSIIQGTTEEFGRINLLENSQDLSDANLKFLLFGK